MPQKTVYDIVGYNLVEAGFIGHILNLKKHMGNPESIKSDVDKNYPIHYHTTMQIGHMAIIYVLFVAPNFTDDVEEYVDSLNNNPELNTIKRRGCLPCEVRFGVITYDDLAMSLLAKAPSTAVRSFLISYGTNVLTLEEETQAKKQYAKLMSGMSKKEIANLVQSF